jgi:hypothetical protein
MLAFVIWCPVSTIWYPHSAFRVSPLPALAVSCRSLRRCGEGDGYSFATKSVHIGDIFVTALSGLVGLRSQVRVLPLLREFRVLALTLESRGRIEGDARFFFMKAPTTELRALKPDTAKLDRRH